MTEPVDNKSTYEDASVVGFYADFADVFAPEEVWLAAYADELAGDVLDLGVGAGRSTLFLHPRARRYVGVDYSGALVEAARKRIPDAEFRMEDARDLSAFADQTFDTVLFTFNGLDYIDHEGRLRVLGEVHRVLRPGGLFLFATHNRDWTRFDRLSWGRDLGLTRRRLRMIKRTLRRLPHHREMRRHAVHEPGYAIVNDEGHDFALMTYYIRREDQVRQLDSAGFATEGVWSLDGTACGGTDTSSNSLHYAARRR